MTKQAVEGLSVVKSDLDGLLAQLTADEWLLASACAGWRVRDVVAHLGASAREVLDPEPAPAGEPPMPEERERQHDVLVDRRRERPLEEILDEYRTYSERLVAMQRGLQDEPRASFEVPVAGLGTYPMHSIANALAFDYYCHLHHDILVPGGPIERPGAEPTADALRAAVEWMLLGLPQMQGPGLADALHAPLTLHLAGPGGGAWTMSRPESRGPVVVVEGEGADTVVTSDPHSFIAWGTKRRDWRADCTVVGDEAAAARFLDALNII
jgi:uncharacterized protein (TIGR03083 family)